MFAYIRFKIVSVVASLASLKLGYLGRPSKLNRSIWKTIL